jgi:hypothetical protein
LGRIASARQVFHQYPVKRAGAPTDQWPRCRLRRRDWRARDGRDVIEGAGVNGYISLVGSSLSPSGTGLDPLLLTDHSSILDASEKKEEQRKMAAQ